MFPLTKGTITYQAHVNIPEGTYEEEHGRDGFYGPVSHLYRTHAPTAWSRIDGPLKPRAFNCNHLQETPSENGSETSDLLGRVPVLYN
ncbi:MAG: hypothetical protein K2X66_12835, partial [Cyanobacteria bacterium]|nr:hypothetical protein [Cyanobacteriota bacterium]